MAPLNNPSIVVVVTLNGSSQYGGVVAAPVFKEIATAALRILEVPKDVPEASTPDLMLAKADKDSRNDLAIASLSEPDEAEGKELMQVAMVTSTPVEGTRVPDFVGKTMRAVLAQSTAAGVPVDVVGRGIAKGQKPPPGSILPRGEVVRVVFAR